MSARLPVSPTPQRSPRQDGETTRDTLLDVAGRLFAEHGYLGTSSKDICLRAGVNMAAVNYHFGSRDGLYAAVLVEAHRQVISQEELRALVASDQPAKDRVRGLMAHLVAQMGQDETSWGFKVVLREVMAPSPLASTLVDQAIVPKAGIVAGLIADCMGLPHDHPKVQRGLMMTVVPCIVLLLAPPGLREKALPALQPGSPDLADHMATFALAGLDALADAP